ncbi:hypothetical protein BKA56DRAFT_599990, partial [Ilyonectria sp. MPI-CAGE-AT-0026]
MSKCIIACLMSLPATYEGGPCPHTRHSIIFMIRMMTSLCSGADTVRISVAQPGSDSVAIGSTQCVGAAKCRTSKRNPTAERYPRRSRLCVRGQALYPAPGAMYEGRKERTAPSARNV